MKRMIWIICICLIAIVVGALFVAPTFGVAYAQTEEIKEDVPPQIEQQTQQETQEDFSFATYFRKEWLDKLIQYCFVSLGALTAIMVTLKRVKTAHELLKKDATDIKTTQNKLDESDKQLQEAARLYRATLDVLDKTLAAIEAMRQDDAAQNTRTRETLDSMQEAMRLAYCTSPTLINTGYAKQIAEVLEVNDETSV